MKNLVLIPLLSPTLLWAQNAEGLIAEAGATPVRAPAPDPLMQIAMWVLIGVVFYMLLIRPQQKRVKEHQQLINNLRRGDKVVTTGGVVGVIKRVLENDEIVVEVAEGVSITVLKQYVSSVLNKSEPVANENKKATK